MNWRNKKMVEPKISIVIPVYNVEKYLKKCLESVINQTYKNLEIIVIDDGSSDNSPMICDEYARKDYRIKCLHQDNSGVSSARNKGIECATGDYVHFLDSDDFLDLDAYAFLIKTMTDNHSEAIGFEYYTTYLDGKDIPHIVQSERYGLRDKKGAIYEHLFGSSVFLWTKILPMSIVKDIRLRTDIYRGEDTLFALDAISKINKMYFSSKPVLHYVQSEDSACRGSFRVSQLTALKAIPIMERFFLNYYPEWLNKWRIKYMHLVTTLYRDMYLDGGPYKSEKQYVYDVFIDLWKKTGGANGCTKKAKLKFRLFMFNPSLYCSFSKWIHNKSLQ